MRMVKAMIIAFSMYSKIPMPQFEWKDEDMKYMLCFFPWIGAVIGGGIYLWGMLCEKYDIGLFGYTFIGTAIPLLLTGGFHADGFMDTMDAFCSYQPRERKLEILKDSHIGAFAVIMIGVYGLIYMAAFSEIGDKNLLQILCAGFFLSRCLSGISVVSFPSAKKEGMLYSFASKAEKNIVKISLYTQGILCVLFMLWRALFVGMIVVVAAMCAFTYYYDRSKTELGGITGDTAGYFVLLCECSMVVVAAVIDIVWI